MANPFIGEIRLVAFTFAPQGWASCDGQLLPIAQNTALFSLLGTTYGGNGQTTFALPDFRGRVPIHAGQGPGLAAYTQGESAGTEGVTLTTSQIPLHSHQLNASAAEHTSNRPGGRAVARGGAYDAAPDGATALHSGSIAGVGGSQPHTNLQPYLAVRFIIAMQGIFPSQ
jgi:microcystin-dependent protein